MINRPRVLLSAFACDPITGSEPYVGWNWAEMLADDVELHVVTRVYSRLSIGAHPLTRKVTFHYVDLPFAGGKDHYWRWIKPYYVVWQLLALFHMWKVHKRVRFDIAHHLTYNNIDVSGFMWLLPGVRFVWGPVGGGQTPPDTLKEVFGDRWAMQQFRALLKRFARINPAVRMALRRARLVLFANEETCDLVRDFCSRSELMIETAIEARPQTEMPVKHGPVRFLWLSNVIPRKALVLAVDAFARATEIAGPAWPTILDVVGEGEQLPAIKERSTQLGLGARIVFHGRIPHADVDAHMAAADIFIFTSVQDTSGNVVLEAMANGKPVIALRHQGVKNMLTMGGGILVEIGDYETTVGRFAEAMLKLSYDSAIRRNKGELARQEIGLRHTWSAKRQRVLDLYKSIMAA